MADTLEEMTTELLNELCRDLSIAFVASGGSSEVSLHARQRRAKHAAAIHTVLEICKLVGIEVYDGPERDGSPLGPPLRD